VSVLAEVLNLSRTIVRNSMIYIMMLRLRLFCPTREVEVQWSYLDDMLWHAVVTVIYRRQLPVDFQSSGIHIHEAGTISFTRTNMLIW
jgi:hypothetical protein